MAKKDAKKTLTKKKKILIIAGVVVLVLLAAGTGVAVRWWQDTANRGNDTAENQEELPQLPDVIDNLQNLRTEGDEEAFDQELATALESSDYDDPTKALLYIQQGNAAYDQQDFNAALEAFLQAESLEPSSQTAQLIGFAYEELGNKEKAIEYYQLTIDRLAPNSMVYAADKSYFEERISQLQG